MPSSSADRLASCLFVHDYDYDYEHEHEHEHELREL